MNNSILRLLFLFLPACIWGQLGSSNPYSFYGIGELSSGEGPIQSALGKAYNAYSDSNLVNFNDPSSYSKLAPGFPLFSISLRNNYSSYATPSGNYARNQVSIDHFAMAIPFANRLGLAFGLRPYSNRGYDFVTNQLVDGDSLRYEYLGSGTTSLAFLGFSVNLIQKPKMTWSIGANYGHLFGFVQNERRAGIAVNGRILDGGIGIQSQRLRAFNGDFSTSFDYRLNPNNQFHIVGAIDPQQKWNTVFGNELYYSFSDVSDSKTYQTKDSSFYDGTISSATKMSFGLTYTTYVDRITKKNRSYRSKFDFVLSYRSVAFSEMVERYNGLENQLYLGDFQHFSFGLQYQPNVKVFSGAKTNSLLTKMTYRLGAYSDQLPTYPNGRSVNEFGTTFGFGIPLTIQRARSSVNFSFQYGQRTDGNQLQQTIYGARIGVILSPSLADQWFYKRKLD